MYSSENASITPGFIVSSQVIYNHKMEELYNFAALGYSFVNITGDSVYLTRWNESTNKNEVFVYNTGAAEPVKVVDGIDVLNCESLTRNYSVIKDDRGWKTIYSINGEVIFKTDGDLQISPMNGGIVVSTMINGVARNYVVYAAAAK